MVADRQTVIGAFVLGGVALGLCAIVLFGNIRLFSASRRAVIVFEGSVSGLSIGAPVRFRGVRVGGVESISIQFEAGTQTAYIPVTLQLEPERVRVSPLAQGEAGLNLASLVARGLRAELNVQSFVTGQSEINLDFDPVSTAVFHPAITKLEEIPIRQSSMQRITEQLTQLPLRELAVTTVTSLESVRALSGRLETDLPPLIASVRATSDNSAHAVEVASQAIANLQSKLDGTLDRFGQLAGNADQQISQRSADLRTLLISANQSVIQSRDVLTDLKNLTSVRGEARVNLDATLRDLAASSSSLRGLARDVENNPQLLLLGRRP